MDNLAPNSESATGTASSSPPGEAEAAAIQKPETATLHAARSVWSRTARIMGKRAWRDPNTFFIMVFTLVLSVATIALWASTARLADLAQEEAAATHESLVMSRRAYISIDYQYLPVLDANNKNGDEYAVLTWVLFTVFKNSGNTPTKAAVSHRNWAIVADDVADPFTLVYEPQLTHLSIGAQATLNSLPLSIDKKTAQEIASGAKKFYVWGWIEYGDIFPSSPRHRTEYSSRVYIEGNPATSRATFRFIQAGPHNDFVDLPATTSGRQK